MIHARLTNTLAVDIFVSNEHRQAFLEELQRLRLVHLDEYAAHYPILLQILDELGIDA